MKSYAAATLASAQNARFQWLKWSVLGLFSRKLGLYIRAAYNDSLGWAHDSAAKSSCSDETG